MFSFDSCPACRVSLPPGPTRTRLQCPSCSKAFGSETALRQHCAALGRKGAGGPNARCMFDDRLPIESGWSCRGLRSAGMVQNMNRAAARLAGLDSDLDGSNSAGRGGPGGQLSPVPPIPPPPRPTQTRMCPDRPLTHLPLPAGPPPRLRCLRYIG